MRRILLLTILIFVKLIVYSQQLWEQKYNDKVAQTFTITLANKFILAGSKYEPMLQRWHIFQTDSNGQIEWDTTFINGSPGLPTCIKPTQDSGYIVGGYNGNYPYLLKFDKNNIFEWESEIKTNHAGLSIKDILFSNNKYLVVGGGNYSIDDGLFISELNLVGDTLSTAYYENLPTGVTIFESFDNSFYCLSNRGMLLKVNSNGDTLWTKQTLENFISKSMVKTNDSCIMISGNEFIGNKLIFLKVDRDGGIIWKKTYSNDGYSYNLNSSVSTTIDNGFITANYMEPLQQNESNLWIMKLNEKGDSLFSITTDVKLRPENIIETNDNLYVFLANDQYQRPRLIKTDETGDVITTIYSTEQNSQISYYPNPVQDRLTIKLDKTPLNKGYYRLYNSFGVLIKENVLNQRTTIDMSNFNSGVYILNMMVDNEIISRKILK